MTTPGQKPRGGAAGENTGEPTGSFGPGPDDDGFVTHAFQPGDVILDRYRIERPIGEGGMGVLFAARHLALHEDVALKFVSFATSKNEVATERLFREARVTAKLKSDHVVRVIDVGIAPPGVPFIAMELLEGEDLRARLQDGERLPVRKALEYVICACEPLAEAHALGVVHRDVKPSNIFLARRADGREVVKLLDFGVSKISRPLEAPLSELTGTDMVIGSPRYMSPEQLGAAGDVDGRSDVWSLAAVLYECLAGHPPFRARTLTEYCMVLGNAKLPPALETLRDDVPPEVDAAVARALAFERNERTPDVSTFARELARALPPTHPLRQQWLGALGSMPPPAGAPPIATPAPPTETSASLVSAARAQPAPRGRLRTGAALAVLATVIGMVTWLSTRHAPEAVPEATPAAAPPVAPPLSASVAAVVPEPPPTGSASVAPPAPPVVSAKAPPARLAPATVHPPSPVTPSKPPASASPPPPASTPPPVASATPAPAPVPKPDPFGDRR